VAGGGLFDLTEAVAASTIVRMKRRIAIVGLILALFDILKFRPLFLKTRAKRYTEAVEAREREMENLDRLYVESSAIQSSHRLDSMRAAMMRAAWAVQRGDGQTKNAEEARRQAVEPQSMTT
jgi:hypothetical protein